MPITASTTVDLTEAQVALRQQIQDVIDDHIPQRVHGAGHNGCTCGGIYIDHGAHIVAMIAQAVEHRP